MSKKYDKILHKLSLLQKLRPLSSAQTKLIREVYGIEEAYASNAIEGSTLNLKETHMYLAFGITAKGKPIRDHLEASGHRAAMEYIYEMADSKNRRRLTEVDIRQLHTLLFLSSWSLDAQLKNRVGKYKTENNHVLTRSGKIHYYADAQDIPKLMSDFVKIFNSRSKKNNPVETAARIHHNFTAMHPFADGNGRMARILSNLFLIQMGWPPFTISPKNRELYYYCLEQADQNKWLPLHNFFADRLLQGINAVLRILNKKYQPTTAKQSLYHLRIKAELTQAKLAKLTGIAQARISKIESGKQSPGLKTLKKLAKALNCSVSDF